VDQQLTDQTKRHQVPTNDEIKTEEQKKTRKQSNLISRQDAAEGDETRAEALEADQNRWKKQE